MKKIVFLFLLVISMQLWGIEKNGSYSNFLSYSGGTSGSAVLDGNEVVITPNAVERRGAVWSRDVFDLSENFHLEYKIYLGENKSELADASFEKQYTDRRGYKDIGADGMAFVLKSIDHKGVPYGKAGADIGYGGGNFPHSFGVKFDTYTNPGSDPEAKYFRDLGRWGIENVTKDHIAFIAGGKIATNSEDSGIIGGNSQPLEINEMEDGGWHNVIIDWDAQSNTFTYTFDGVGQTYNGDIVKEYLGANSADTKNSANYKERSKVYFGFTASTGSFMNEQKLKDVSVKGTIPTGDYKLDITKKVIGKTTGYKKGETIHYEITITNPGEETLYNIKLADAKSVRIEGIGDIDNIGGTSDVNLKGGKWTWTELKPGVQNSIVTTATKEVKQEDINEGRIVRIATVEARTGNASGDAIYASDKKTVYPYIHNELEVKKEIINGDHYTKVGDKINYRFTIENKGNTTLTDISVLDKKIPGVFLKVLNPKVPGVLSPGEIAEGEGSYPVAQADIDAGEVINTANFRAVQPDGNPIEKSTTAIAYAIKLGIVKSVDGNPTVAEDDQTLKYRIKVTNNSKVEVTGAKLEDKLVSKFFTGQTPTNVKVNGGAPSGDLETGINLPIIEPGKFAEVTFDIKAIYPAITKPEDKVENTAKLTYDGNSNNSNTVILDIKKPDLTNDLTIVKSIDGDPKVAEDGQILKYRLTVNNSSKVEVTGAQVLDDLDPKFFGIQTPMNLEVNGVASSEVLKTGVDLPIIAPGDSVDVTFEVKVAYPDVTKPDDKIVNIATLKYNNDSVDSNKKELDIKKPDLTNDLTIVKSIDGDPKVAEDGQILKYRLTVNNSSKVEVTGAQVLDDLDPKFFGIQTPMNLEVNGVASSEVLKTGVDLPIIAPGDSVDVTFEVKVAYPDVTKPDDKIVNIATLKYNNDSVDSNKKELDIKKPDLTNDLTIVKSIDGDPKVAEDGQILKYRLTVNNSSKVEVTGAQVLDDLDPKFFGIQTPMNLEVNGVASSEVLKTGVDLPIIAPGDSVDVTFEVKVAYPDVTKPDDKIVNIATLKYNNDSVDSNKKELDIKKPDLTNDLTIVKSIDGDPKVAEDGQILKYRLTVNNSSKVEVTGAQVLDDLDPKFFGIQTPMNLEVNGVASSEVLKTGVDLPIIAPGDSVDVTFEVKVAYPDVTKPDDKIVNIATLKYNNDSVDSNKKELDIKKPDLTNDLTIVKSIDGDPKVAEDGQILKYRLTVNNSSKVEVTGAQVLDDLDPKFFGIQTPMNLEVNGVASSEVLKTGVDLPIIAPGDSVDVTFEVKVAYPDVTKPDDKIVNIATLKYNNDSVDSNKKELDIKKPDLTNDLTIVKSIDGDPKVAEDGQILKYRLTVNNSSKVEVTGAQVLDDLDPKFFGIQTPMNLEVNGVASSEVLKTGVDLPIIAPGDSVDVTFEVKVAYPDVTKPDDKIVNIATLKYNNDSVDSNKKELDIKKPDLTNDLTIVKSIDGDPKVAEDGQILKYRLTVNNSSKVEVTGAQVLDDLDPKFFGIQTPMNLEVNGVASSEVLKTGVDLPIIAPGDSVDVTFEVKVAYPDVTKPDDKIVNIATLKYNNDSVDSNKKELDIKKPDLTNDLTIVKSIDGDPKVAEDGQILKYRLTVNNSSKVEVTGAQVLDDLDPKFFGIQTPMNLEVNGVASSEVLKTGVDLPIIAPGDSVDVTFEVKVAYPDVTKPDDKIVNIATLKYNNDSVDSNKKELDIKKPDLTNDLTIVKSIDGDPKVAEDGQILKYRLTVNNSSKVEVTGAQVLDDLDPKFFGIQTPMNLEVNGVASSEVLKTGVDLPIIAPGDSVDVTFEVKVAYPDVTKPDDKIVNIATLKYNNDSVDSNKKELDIKKPDLTNDLTIVKSIDGDPKVAEDGQILKYRLTVNNSSKVEVTGAQVLDDLDPKFFGIQTPMNLEVNGVASSEVLKTGVDLPIIAPGDSVDVTFEVKVAYPDVTKPDDKIVNIATLKYNNDSVDSNKKELDIKKPDLTNDLTIVKSIDGDPKVAEDGQILKYRLTVNNSSKVEVTGAQVLDDLDPKFFGIQTPMNLEVNGVASSEVLKTGVDLPIIAPGDSVDVTFEVKVAYPDVTKPDDKIVNIATLKYNNDSVDSNKKELDIKKPDLTNDLTIVKSIDGDPKVAEDGQILKYRLTVNNSSKVEVTGAQVLDDLDPKFFGIQTPMNLEVNGVASSEVLKTGVDLPIIAPGDSVDVTFEVKVAYPDVTKPDDKIVNIATLKYNNDSVDSNKKELDIKKPDLTNDLTIVKSIDGDPKVAEDGQILKYRLTVNNSSKVEVTGAQVLDDLDPKFFGIQTPMNLEVNGVASSEVLKTGVDLPIIAPGDSVDVTFEVKVAYPDVTKPDDKIVNIATLKYNNDSVDSNKKELDIKKPDLTNDLTIVKSIDGDPKVAEDGQILKYRLTVNNSSKVEVTGAQVLDDLDPKFFGIQTPMNLEVNGVASSEVLKTGVDLPIIAPGDSVDVTFEVKVAYPDVTKPDDKIVNIATLKYNNDSVDSNKKELDIKKPDLTNDLTIVKSIDGDPKVAEDGQILKYRLTVNNSSKVEVTGAQVLDDLDPKFFGIQTPMNLEVNGVASSEVLKTGVDLPIIAPGDSVDVTFEVKVAYPDVTKPDDKIVNIATLKYNNDSVDSNKKELDIKKPDLTNDLTIVKSIDGDPKVAEDGQILKYRLTVNNSSKVEVTGAQVLDKLDSKFFENKNPTNVKVNGGAPSGDVKTGINLPTIAPGKSAVVTFDINAIYPVGTLSEDKIENIATLTYNSKSKDSNKVSLPIQKLIATDLDIKLQVEDLGGDGFEKGDGIVDDGEEAEYTISITNPTPVNAVNVLVSDDYKDLYLYKNDSYKYVSSDAKKLTGKDLKEGVILPEIKAGETIKLKFMVGFSYEGKNVDQDDTIPNEAYLSLQETSPLKKLRRAIAPINKNSNKVVLKVAKPTYTLSKEIRNKKDEFYPGDLVVYDITLENTSKVIGKNIKIEDKVSEIKAFENWTWESGVSKTPESLLKTGLRKDLSENGIELLAGEIKRYTVVGRLKDSLSKGEVKNTVKAGENLELQAEAVLKVKDAQIKVTKTAKKKWVSIGDLISYKITVQNLSGNKGTVLKNLSLKDMMPPGFKYAEGSGKVDGDDADEDLRGRTIYFNNLELVGNKKIEITYILRIGTGVKPGSYKNKAWIENTSGKNLSNIGEASVEVINDPLFNSTVIIGKVFHDRDNDGWQDDANAYDIRVETLSSQDNYLDGSVKKGDEEWRISSESKELLLGNLGGRGDENEKSQKVILRRRVKDPKKIGDILIKSKEGSNITLKSTGEILRNHSGNRNLTGVDLKVVRRVIKDPKYREELKDVKSFKKVRIENFIAPIYFDSAYANIRDSENEKLKQYLEKLSNKKNLKLVIVGYTDSQRPSKRAKFKNNHELSIARANTLKDYLSMKLDLSEEMFVIDGKGPKNPKGSNRTSSGRQLNRRTEIVIEYDEEVTKQLPLKIDESDYFEEVEIRNDGILEEGIPGVRLATVEGLVIETDQFGRYHVDGIDDIPDRGKNFIIKVDKVTLPSGTEFTTENPRVKTLTKVMEKFNFGVKIPKVKRRVKEKEVRVRVGSVFFLTDKWNVREDQIDNLKKISKLLTEYRGGVIVVEGNADSRASNKYNQILALKRAKSIGKELEKIMGKEMISNVKIVTDLSGGER